jgi:alginate O-acetyltransferase complex protein AlgI
MSGDFDTLSFYLDLLAITPLLLLAVIVPVPSIVKRVFFILATIYLLYFIAPRLTLFYVIAWTLVFVLHRAVASLAERQAGLAVFWATVIVLLAPMVLWKLNYDEFNVAFNLWGNSAIRPLSDRLYSIDLARTIIIPIGLSFATFRAIDLIIKTYLGQLGKLSYDRVMFYGFFAPVQIIGPVIQYTEIQKQSEIFARPASGDIYQGLLRLFMGGFKVLVIAVALQPSAAVFSAYEYQSVPMIWLLLVIYTWFFYINFSGYSDIAIGMSRLLGFKLLENFHYPYFQRNVADYWNNWHMSLSHFAQRNVYVPLGGYRKKTQYLAIFATIMVIAMWHNITWGMVVFGIYHGLGLIVHRIWSQRNPPMGSDERLWQLWCKIGATYLFVTLGFPLLILPLNYALDFYSALIGL